MTKTEMVQMFCLRMNYPPAPDYDVLQRIEQFFNDTLQELVSEPGIGAWVSRHQPNLTFASVANQAVYGLVGSGGRIDAIQDRTNDFTLMPRSIDWWRRVCPDPSAYTGTPSDWIPLGTIAVAVQPSDASRLFVDSTSASDVQKATIEGVRTGGYPQTATVTLTGVTAIDINTATTDWVEVTKFYVNQPAVGTITLHEDASGGTELARIPIGETASLYQGVALHPTPASAITYYVESERDLPYMQHAKDSPPIPARFHRVIVDGALWREYEKREDVRALSARRTYERGVSHLRYFVTCPTDFLPSREGRVERSRLGPYYPSDTF